MKIVHAFAATMPLVLAWMVGCGGSDNDPAGGSGGASGGAGSGGALAGPGSGGAAEGGSTAVGGGPGAGGGAGAAAVGPCEETETFELGRSPTREIFVDAGAVGPGDGSLADPYPTLDAALDAATPGTAIRLLAGVHQGGAFAAGLAGTADAPIWIGGAPNQPQPTVAGGSNGFQLSGATFVIVHDLEITGQESNGLNIDDGETASGASHDLIFRDLYIHDIGSGGNQDCLKLSGIDRYHVLESEFVGCSGGSAIDHVGCHHGVIAGNVFSDLAGNGVQSKGGSDDILITQNLFVEAGERAVNMGGSTDYEFFRPALSTSSENYEARDIRVIANVFRRGLSPIAFVGCVDCLAANNTIIEPQQWVVRILQETTSTAEYAFAPAQGGRFVNNIIHYRLADLSTHVNVGPDTDPDSFVFSNDLWYAADAPEDSEPSYLPVIETDGVYGEDPGFAVDSDGSIPASSPAAGAGLPLGELVGDIAGRCYETPPSIGAHEVE